MIFVSFGRPILDLTVKLHPPQLFVSIGGVEMNFAIDAAVLGKDAIFLGALGKDILYEKIVKLAKKVKKLRLEHIQIKSKKSGIIALVVGRNEKVLYKLVDYGASEDFHFTPAIQQEIEKISKEGIFFTSFFSANSPKLKIEWQKIVKCAKRNSLKIALNIGGISTVKEEDLSSILNFVKETADFIFMNREEAERIDLAEFGSALLVITDQNGPAVAKFKEKKWEIAPRKTIVVTRPYSIGAGDAFAAAFLVKYLEGEEIEEAMRYAHQIAAVKLTLPTSHLLPEAFEKGVIE
jgi:sugar/nucleoside kinase (ribokinase family)